MMTTPVSQRLTKLPKYIRLLLCTLAGALVPFSFAPFNIWPAGIAALIALALLLHRQSLKNVLWSSWFFGVGMYGFGVSWIYISISGFGGAPAPLAAFLVALFTLFMAGLFIIPFYVYGRWFSQSSLATLVAFPTTWLISEWLRTWLLTGFPWLFIGYADLHNWLAGWAPITGVMGLSFISAITAGTLAQVLLQPKASRPLITAVLLSCLFWCGGALLQHTQWTQQSNNPTSVAVVQPNIDQEQKWQTDFRETNMDLLRTQTEPLWGRKIIIWPEAAVTELYSDALPFLNEMNDKASDSHSGLITGIIFDDAAKDAYYNSVVTFGDAIGIYHKRRLVPFGEYVPMEWLRNLIEFFNLPTSYISLGPDNQHGLKVDDMFIAPSVCYEVAYPDLVAQSARDSQLLLSISNLGWFGDSLGRHQFMEMAQMRALETQHYYIYSTNNGPSAIFNPRGDILVQTPAFTRTVLTGDVYSTTGNTPFMRWGSWPLVVIAFLAWALMLYARIRWHKSIAPAMRSES